MYCTGVKESMYRNIEEYVRYKQLEPELLEHIEDIVDERDELKRLTEELQAKLDRLVPPDFM